MIAILTRFHGPTTMRGDRVTATTYANGSRQSVTLSYNPDPWGSREVDNHRPAAEALAAKLGFTMDPAHFAEEPAARSRGYVFLAKRKG